MHLLCRCLYNLKKPLLSLALGAGMLGLGVQPLSGQLENREIFVIHINSARSAELSPAQIIPISSFRSAAFHEYVVAPYRITEFTLSLMGEGNTVRFYALEPMDGSDVRAAGERATGERTRFPQTVRPPSGGDDALRRLRAPDFQEEVYKTYPHSTHAGTAEYILSSPSQVKAFRDLFFQVINSETSINRAFRELEFFIDVHEGSVRFRKGDDEGPD